MQEMASGKSRRIGDLPEITGVDAAEAKAAGGQDGVEHEVAA